MAYCSVNISWFVTAGTELIYERRFNGPRVVLRMVCMRWGIFNKVFALWPFFILYCPHHVHVILGEEGCVSGDRVKLGLLRKMSRTPSVWKTWSLDRGWHSLVKATRAKERKPIAKWAGLWPIKERIEPASFKELLWLTSYRTAYLN